MLQGGLALACALIATGCSGSGSHESQPLPTTTTTLAGMPCPFRAQSCTPEQVRATVTTLFEKSGTTPTEATCLAALIAPAHSMTEAFEASEPAKDADAARCLGSRARLVTVGVKLITTVRQIDPQFARSALHGEDCKSSSSEGVVSISDATQGSPPSNWETMTPEQLRKAGWRREVETSPSTCEPAP
jgi:hypothetical protein